MPLEIEYSSGKDSFRKGVRYRLWADEDVSSNGRPKNWMEMDQFVFSIHRRLVLGRHVSEDTEKQGVGLKQK